MSVIALLAYAVIAALSVLPVARAAVRMFCAPGSADRTDYTFGAVLALLLAPLWPFTLTVLLVRNRLMAEAEAERAAQLDRQRRP